MAEILSFHPVKSERYHNFGYGKSLSYNMDHSEYHGIYDMAKLKGQFIGIFVFHSKADLNFKNCNPKYPAPVKNTQYDSLVVLMLKYSHCQYK